MPLESSIIVSKYGDYLTDFEKIEIAEYKTIYYFGKDAHKIIPSVEES